MTRDRTDSSEKEIRDQAADFLARVHAEDASEGDWLDLEAWLSASAAHRDAYDRAEALWAELDDGRLAIAAGLEDDASPANVVGLPARPTRRRSLRWIAAAAAVVAVCLIGSLFLISLQISPKTETYATRAGETRAITLDDGTRIDLNGASSLTVRMGRTERRVVMAQAEASFDVAHDTNRPFLIEAGDSEIRVVGTEFNVGRHAGRTTVTVRRGVVEVKPRTGADAPARLARGSQLTVVDGDGPAVVRAVDPDEAFAWRSGRLIYRDRPLAEVAADLSRRFTIPVTVAPDAQAVRFTGVLVLDNEDAVISRLEALAPVIADHTASAIKLHSAKN